MGKLIATAGAVLAVAVWVLLFVILGVGLVTSFIAGGCVLAATGIAAAMSEVTPIGRAPVTTTGLFVGIAAFVIMEVVLSITIWVDIVSALAAIGIYDIAAAAIRPLSAAGKVEAQTVRPTPGTTPSPAYGNGHSREPLGAR